MMASYKIYHDSYTSAVQEAESHAVSKGFKVDPEESADVVGLQSRRPREGETERYSLSLSYAIRDWVKCKKALHVQITCLEPGKFELNCYIL